MYPREKIQHPLPANDDNHEVVRSVRDVPPAHYILKIESFSMLSQLLQKTGVDKYESNDFEAGGYKWKLLLYPDGNKNRHVKGYISLYLAMSKTKNLALGFEVNVIFKLFVFDQIRDKYVTLEDGRVRRFHSLKTERGIHQLLSLSTFNDPSSGYLIDDCCVFGAEVFVIKCKPKGEQLTMINEPTNATFTWKLENFSRLKDQSHCSELFDFRGCKWMLELYPSGDSRATEKSLSLYLHIQDHSILRFGWKLYVEYQLILKDQVNGKHYQLMVQQWFCSSATGYGFADFISQNNLRDEKNGFLLNDTLVVEGQITFISVVNSFT